MRSHRILSLIVLAALILASLPYIVGYAICPPGARFMGLTHNIDDACVYLSWIRQTADGHILLRNSFAVEPHPRMQFNLFFFILGWCSRALHLAPITIYHLARILLGAGLLLSVFKFARLFVDDCRSRVGVILVLTFSSGLSWMFGSPRPPLSSVDGWQPEAITFLSMYLNPLFLCGQCLMIGTLYYLMRCKESGRIMHAVLSGVCLLLLANIHTYDVLTVGAVWSAFLIVLFVTQRRVNVRLIGLSFLAAAISSPALLYQRHVYLTDAVYRLRVNTPTPSPEIWSYFAGYGLLGIAAIAGAVALRKHHKESLLLLVWSVVGFILPYAPLAQQRKLVMGLQIPLAILGTLFVMRWADRGKRISPFVATLLFVVIAAPSNLQFLARDTLALTQNETATGMHRPYLTNQELAGLDWLRAHTSEDKVVLASPDIAIFVPSVSGNLAYAGHWSETPDYSGKLTNWFLFVDNSTPDEVRARILRNGRIAYFWWNTSFTSIPSMRADEPPGPIFNPNDAHYLRQVFAAGPIRIYEVVIGNTE